MDAERQVRLVRDAHARDARVLRIYGGTDEIQISAIARDLLSR